MNVFCLSKNEESEILSFLATREGVDTYLIDHDEEVEEHDVEKCIILIDIDTFKDHGFTLASRISAKDNKVALVVGVTTMVVDSTSSKFDFFFSSIESFIEKFDSILDKYEQA